MRRWLSGRRKSGGPRGSIGLSDGWGADRAPPPLDLFQPQRLAQLQLGLGRGPPGARAVAGRRRIEQVKRRNTPAGNIRGVPLLPVQPIPRIVKLLLA